MGLTYSELEKLALELDRGDREQLLGALVKSLRDGLPGSSQPRLREEWGREVERRVAAWDDGDTATVDAAALLASLRRRVS